MLFGEVIKLDRGFPLVRVESGEEYRCEHATTLIKEGDTRAVIGDRVKIAAPERHDKALIEEILLRETALIRKDPTEQAIPQILAANFDLVIIAQPLVDINIRRLEREMVLAHETQAKVLVVFTKADLAENEDIKQQLDEAIDLIGETPHVVISAEDPASIEGVRTHIPSGITAVLIGKSGVGKSSLINLLVGREVQETATVREGDGKGRHTTVSREIIAIPQGGRVIDMPGVRGVGLWEADTGIELTFADIEEIAQNCKFRDCKHGSEPGCAVRKAVEVGQIAQKRLDSYRALKREVKDMQIRKEEAQRIKPRKKRS